MFSIRDAQLAILSQAAFLRYVESIVDRLTKSGVGSIGEARAEIRATVIEEIDHAESLGFIREAEVTPFILLIVTFGSTFAESPLADWLLAVLEATEWPAERRMDAVYALLPEAERMFYFET